MITLLITLVIVGVCMYLLNRFVPIAEPFRTIINVVVVLIVIVWLLQAVGVDGLPHLHLK